MGSSSIAPEANKSKNIGNIHPGMNADIREGGVEHLSSDKEVVLATFVLDGKEFAIDVGRVREAVLLPSDVIRIPSSLDILDGVMNLRGAIVPLLNLKRRLSFTPATYGPDCRIAIARCLGRFFGLMFDATQEVLRVRESQIASYRHSDETDYVTEGIINLEGGRRLVQVLDPEALFRTYDLPEINGLDTGDAVTRLRRVEMVKAAVFELSGEQYALPLCAIQEAIEVPRFEKRVLVEAYIDGVFSLRGSLTTVIDLRDYWGLNKKDVDSRSRVVILREPESLGFRVDALVDIIEFEKDAVIPFPALSNRSSVHAAISGLVVMDGRNVLLLDAAKILSDEAKKQLRGNLQLHQKKPDGSDRMGRLGSRMAQRRDTNDAEEMERTYITFRLDESFAIDINCFQEILNRGCESVRLPGQVPYMEGMLSLRGEAIPVVNLRAYYNLSPCLAPDAEKILVLDVGSGKLGVVVDDVEAIVTHKSDSRKGQGAIRRGGSSSYSRHISHAISATDDGGTQKMVLVFDMESFFKEHIRVSA